METYYNLIKRIYDDLTAKDLMIPEKLVLVWVLNNLTTEYKSFILITTQLLRRSPEIHLTDLFANLIDKSRRLKNRDSETM